MDEKGILKLVGSIDKIKLSYDSRHSIILLLNHSLTMKLVVSFPEKLSYTRTDEELSHTITLEIIWTGDNEEDVRSGQLRSQGNNEEWAGTQKIKSRFSHYSVDLL